MLRKLLEQLIGRKPHPSQTAERLKEGYAALVAERLETARAIAKEVLSIAPASFGARLLMAQASASIGDQTLALQHVDAAIALQPSNAEGYYVRALIHESDGRTTQAIADYARVLDFDGRNQAALDKKGALHDARGEFEASLACAEQLVRISPDDAEMHHKLAITLRELGRLADAERWLRKAIEISPRFDVARAHLALTLIELGRFEEAEAKLTALLVDAPEQQDACWAAAVLHLLHGRYQTGWMYYEARESRRDPDLRLPDIPEWNGEPIAEGALMINAEQGLGDQVMFASCLPDVLRTIPKCIVSCEARLKTLFERSFPQLYVTTMGSGGAPYPAEVPHPVRAQIMMGSLPRIYRRNLDQFPQHAGYLQADPEDVVRWRKRLAALGPGLKVGLAWTGGTPKTRRSLRSLELEHLLPVLSMPDCSFVSLQYMDSRAEIAALRDRHGLVVHEFPSAIADYDQTAALVTAIDLIISVCTTVVHLAGAVGKEVWVLAPSIPEWRYRLHGTAMPWHPSARLWRASPEGCWDAAIGGVARELRTRASFTR